MSNPPSDSIPDLTAAILARTSGPACGRLRDLACDFVDGTLPADDGDLVRRHLDHCTSCQDLVDRLMEATLLLPGFARLDPGAGFTAAVLNRTRPVSALRVQSQDRLLAGWTRLMRRPRAALEAAYLATAAGLILTQVPLPGAQRQAGAALASLVRTESQASLAKVRSHGHAWAHRTRAFSSARLLPPPESAWSALWSRLTRHLGQAWVNLVKVARQVRARAWREQPMPPPRPTEPSGASPRPVL